MPRSANGLPYSTGRLPSAVAGNGSTAYVATSGNAASALWPTTALTVALWVKPFALPASNGAAIGLVDKYSGGAGWRLDLYLNGTVQSLLFEAGATAFTPSVAGQVPIGEWTHLVGTISGTTGTLYLNGGALAGGSGTVGTLSNNSSVNLHIVSGQGTQFLNGQIADVRVYSAACSAAQAEAICQEGASSLDSNLVLWWPCQEGSGTALNDHSGNGLTGGFNGSAAWSSAGPFPAPAAS